METAKKKRTIGEWLMIAIAWAIFLFVIASVLGDPLLKIPYFLVFGWIHFIKDNAARVQFGAEMVLSGVLGWAIGLWLLHAFCRWVMKQKNGEWRFVQSLRLNALFVVMFVSSCALVGCVHQLIWLGNKEIMVNRGKGHPDKHRSIHHFKMLYLSLIDYDQEKGHFPDSLYQLADEGYLAKWDLDKSWLYVENQKKLEPIQYFGKGKSTSDDGSQALLGVPFLYHGRVIYLCIDGSVKQEGIRDGREGIEQYRTFLQTGRWLKEASMR